MTKSSLKWSKSHLFITTQYHVSPFMLISHHHYPQQTFVYQETFLVYWFIFIQEMQDLLDTWSVISAQLLSFSNGTYTPCEPCHCRKKYMLETIYCNYWFWHIGKVKKCYLLCGLWACWWHCWPISDGPCFNFYGSNVTSPAYQAVKVDVSKAHAWCMPHAP